MTDMQDNFANHVELIKAQDGLTDEGAARWRAWTEGPRGYARRLVNTPAYREAAQQYKGRKF